VSAQPKATSLPVPKKKCGSVFLPCK
jgi:hypothetical protein